MNNTIGSRFILGTGALLLSLLVAACAIRPKKYDLQIRPPEHTGIPAVTQPRYDFSSWLEANKQLPRTALIVTMSGGGTRAAAMGHAALSKLATLRSECPPWATEREFCSALDSIILITGISGGSFTAAQFALNGSMGLGQVYQNSILKQNTTGLALKGFINPYYWWDRSQQVVDVFNEMYQVEGRPALYSDLKLAANPFLLLSGTDIVAGRPFPLTQDKFDDICSDLGRLPLATGVAIAGNLPFVLNGVHLENYHVTTGCPALNNGEYKYAHSTDNDVLALRAANPHLNLAEASLARYRLWLRGALPIDVTDSEGGVVKILNPRDRSMKFVHLFDGGLTDNLGIRTMMRTIFNDATLLGLYERGVQTLVVVNVNAHSDNVSRAYDSRSGQNWLPEIVMNSVFGPIEKSSELTSYIEEENLSLFYSSKTVSDSTKIPDAIVIKLDPDLLVGTADAEELREVFKGISLLDQLNDSLIFSIRSVVDKAAASSACWTALTGNKDPNCLRYSPGFRAQPQLVLEGNEIQKAPKHFPSPN